MTQGVPGGLGVVLELPDQGAVGHAPDQPHRVGPHRHQQRARGCSGGGREER